LKKSIIAFLTFAIIGALWLEYFSGNKEQKSKY
jgi:predicted outer membrane lipoprotein